MVPLPHHSQGSRTLWTPLEHYQGSTFLFHLNQPHPNQGTNRCTGLEEELLGKNVQCKQLWWASQSLWFPDPEFVNEAVDIVPEYGLSQFEPRNDLGKKETQLKLRRESWIWVLCIFKTSSSAGQRALHAENKYESISIVASSGCFTGVSGTLGSVFLLVSLSLQLLSSVWLFGKQ